MQKDFRASFASANGYSGFRSYYDQILHNDSFSHVYVLKGGPGTGKSTLMKTLEERYSCSGITTERILCSSDPHSLDGVILACDKTKIAILDGTAPHQRDAQLPGAKDCLVNLAERLDEGALKAARPELADLQKKKALAYKKGYEFLSLCGIINDKIEAECETEDGISTAYGELTHTLEHAEKGDIEVRLYNAFCKDGRVTLPHTSTATQRILLDGNPYVTKHLMQRMVQAVREHHYAATIVADALDENRILSIDIPSIALLITSEAAEYPTRTFYFKRKPFDAEEEMRTFYNGLLSRARERFAEAFSYHKEMESIYGNAIDFSYVNESCERISKELDAWLC